MTGYGSAETNLYTGDGLRSYKNTGGSGNYYVYDGDEPVAELDSAGRVGSVHTFGADGLLSRRWGSVTYFYTFDSQGSTAQQLDGGGNVLCSHLHDGFGNWVTSGSGDTVFGWGGQFGYYTDVQTGLRLCGHRFYDNSTGRWLTRDPIGYGGGVNLYGYCQNDPVNNSDREGFARAGFGGGHKPGGPWHYGGKTKCLPGDSCSVLAAKINMLYNQIRSHEGWSLNYPIWHGGLPDPKQHLEEAFQMLSTVIACEKQYADECKSKAPIPVPAPVTGPEPVTEPDSPINNFLYNLNYNCKRLFGHSPVWGPLPSGAPIWDF